MILSSTDTDYLSLLPDHVIQTILLFLPIQSAVTTCVLSKRWRSVWQGSPDIEFSDNESSPEKFIDQVDTVLLLHSSEKLRKFNLRTGKLIPHCKIDSWVQYTTLHHVENIRLGALCPLYVLPEFVYVCSSIVDMTLDYCRFDLTETTSAINWVCLKSVSLFKTRLSDYELDKILQGSPVLELLKLEKCWGVTNINLAAARKLKELAVDGYGCTWSELNNRVRRIKPVRIELAPHLAVLKLLGFWNSIFYVVLTQEPRNLVEAHLDFSLESRHTVTQTDRRDKLTLNYMLLRLRCVPNLTLGTSCLQMLSSLDIPSGLACSYIQLVLGSRARASTGILWILQNAYFMEKLAIHLHVEEKETPRVIKEKRLLRDFEVFTYRLEEMRESFKCIQKKRLKTIKITGNLQNHSMGGYVYALEQFFNFPSKSELNCTMPNKENTYRLVSMIMSLKTQCRVMVAIQHKNHALIEALKQAAQRLIEANSIESALFVLKKKKKMEKLFYPDDEARFHLEELRDQFISKVKWRRRCHIKDDMKKLVEEENDVGNLEVSDFGV